MLQIVDDYVTYPPTNLRTNAGLSYNNNVKNYIHPIRLSLSIQSYSTSRAWSHVHIIKFIEIPGKDTQSKYKLHPIP